MNVNTILDRACRRTGLQTTGTERTDLLAAFNDVYREAIMEAVADVDRIDCTLLTSDDLYDIVDLVGEIPMGLLGVQLIRGGGVPESLVLVDHQKLMELQRMNLTDRTTYVAPVGYKKLMFFPQPLAGDVVRIYYIPVVADLTDAAVAPSLIPEQFHQSVLLAGTIVQALDKDQRKADVEFWGQRYEAGKQRFRRWVDEYMGESTPWFTSAAGKNVTVWPDQRSR